MNQLRFLILTLLITLAVTGCQSLSRASSVQPEIQNIAPFNLLEQDERDDSVEQPAPPQQWLTLFNDAQLEQWVASAISDNFSLAEARYRVEASYQQRQIAKSGLWPSLSLDASGERTKTASSSTSGATEYGNRYGVNASLSWEMDLWGKVYDGYKAGDLRLQAEQAALEASRQSLAGQVAKAWYQLVTNQQQLALLQQRINNLETNLDIINNGYRQGTYQALDLYLARSDLATERSNLSAQQELTTDSVRQLQLLLGKYPSGSIDELNMEALMLPDITHLKTAAVSSEVVRYRYDLQASFLELAAADRDLAAAHKARFPSFTIAASTGDSGNDYKNLFNSSSLAWNLLGNLTQPLFAGGKLKAQEGQQLSLLRQKEQQYLQALHNAFAEIEQAMSNDRALQMQLQQLTLSKTDAEAAEALAFDEYRQGLQSYTAVLEAQRRAFNARSNVITLHKQLLLNRINFFLALGGNF